MPPFDRRPRLLIAVLAALTLTLAACGGGGGSGGGSDEDAVAKAANQHIEVFFGMLTGQSSGQDLLNVFAPECREGVKAADINAALGLIRLFVPQLADAKIDDVDLGKLSIEKVAEGYEVTALNPAEARVKVKGKWLTFDTWAESLGMSDSDSSAAPGVDESLLIVKRDGKWLIGDCSELSDFGGATSPSTGPGSQRTPTPRAGAGGSKATPVRLGQSARVEDNLWELTVVAVNRDAWPLVQAASRFNDPPAANMKMLMITVRAKNVSTAQKPENIDSFSFRLVGARNQLYDNFDEKHDCGTIPDDLDADLFPGGQAQGNVCFKVASDETGFVLVWEDFFSDELTYFALE